VEEIERITPKNAVHLLPAHPFPTKRNHHHHGNYCDSNGGVPPTFINFLKLNSRPRLNSKMITPISAHTSTLLTSLTEGKKKSKWVPKKPQSVP
jgi:hypothetical protein